MQHDQIRGADLAFQQSGSGDCDLVLVHGFQHDHRAWSPLVDRLDQERYRFTRFDLVGCGASGRPATPQRCTIDEYAADLTALCDRRGMDRPVVIGHSLGGVIALTAALEDPERFAGIVLVAPSSTSGFDFLPDEASFEALAHPTREQQQAFARAAFRRPPPEEYLRDLISAVESASPEHMEGAAHAMRTFTRQPDLAALAALPTLLVCGDRDKHIPLRNHLATQQAIPRCGLQVYYDIAHVPFVETPDTCATDIERFLATIP
ncbi:alpha/beta hydrolase [Saccharopolyspora sp. SCSIO 74807]|uniref:alpha/beta fold hydrolase n=1 Tax=Saccharopolyspora sp. SCSIO 74807 TaxID=3118084 RepID=UPI0030D532EF